MANLKTAVTELLDANNIPYRVLPHTEPVFTMDAAAAQRGVVREEMVKSILLRESKGERYVMACVAGDARLDPKAVRAVLPGECKRLTFASADEIQAKTGYIMGAVAPLCLPDDVPVIFDAAIGYHAKINTSSGDPMFGLELRSRDLMTLSGAQIASIAK